MCAGVFKEELAIHLPKSDWIKFPSLTAVYERKGAC